MATHKGECFCGAVQLEVSGEPEGMGYCHCRSCRSWSGGPVNAFTLWKPEAVRVTAGAEHVGMFQKTAASQRQYCKKCGAKAYVETNTGSYIAPPLVGRGYGPLHGPPYVHVWIFCAICKSEYNSKKD